MSRVKAIERNVMAIYEKPVNLVGYEISKGDYEWLIQQARRADQLEYRVGLEERRSSNLSRQNQRYKQALKFYADEKNFTQSESEYFEGYPPEIMNDRGYKARQALKEESQ